MRFAKTAALISTFLLIANSLFAQENAVGTITGLVVDKSTSRPLEFVNVVLQNKADSSIVTGVVTDKGGRFDFSNIPSGDYFFRFSLIGYLEKKSIPFVIDAQHRKPNFGTVGLTETAISLDEVLVTSQKSLFNNSIDRKIYNVDQDIMSKSGSASELLQNVPSIQVDIDGNVSLRGSENVLMLINGKNSPLMGKSRAEVLQQMPANSIETIEVITNPSAKYKPDGTAGIINLVLKKNTSTGTNGSLTLNTGNNDRYNGNIRLNYNPGDFNLFGGYSVRKDNKNRNNSDRRTQIDSARLPNYYSEDLTSVASPLSHMISLGADCEFDKANSAGISGDYFYNSFTRIEDGQKIFQNNARLTTEAYDRHRHDDEFEREYGLKASYEHRFDGEDHKLRLEYQFSNQPEQEDNHYSNVHSTPVVATTYDNTLIKQDERKSEVTLDYSNPIGEKSTLEAGYAGEFNYRDMDFRGEYFDPIQQAFVKDAAKSNEFIYDDAIHAFYATVEHSFGAFGVLGGIRAEQATIKSNQVTSNIVIPNDYFSFYPSIHCSYKFSEEMEWQINYSRRVRRPEGDDLNPFPEYRDPKTYTRGNPYLLPEYIHSAEFGCKLQNDEFSILPSIYYRSTSNRFTSITELFPDSTLVTTRKNLSSDQSMGVEVILSANAGDWFTAHASANGFYDQINASNLGYSSNKSTIAWSGALTSNVHLSRTSMVQLNSTYNATRLTPQGETRPSFVVNLGLRQELLDGQFTIIATVADVFKTLRRETELDTPLLNQFVVNTRDSRVFYIGVTYRFGTSQSKSKEETIKYDDSI